MSMMKKIVIPTVVLTIIAGVIAGLLAFTYHATGIANLGSGLSDEDRVELAGIIPGAQELTQVNYSATEADLLGVYTDEEKLGVALHIQTAGYAGKSKPIEALVAFDKDGVITGVQIVASQETPGLGTKIENADYLKSYVGVSGSAEEIDTITGATISSKALRSGVDFAIAQFEIVKGEVFQ